MGLTKQLDFRPGVILDETELAARPHWTDGDRIRFVRKRAQKIGGWTKFVSTLFLGVCRGMYAWVSATSTPHLAIGTHLKLYAVPGSISDDTVWATYDITPIRASGTLDADPFTVTPGSDVVAVEDAMHGASEGSYVTFGGATVVKGITINGEYAISRLIDSGNYEIIQGPGSVALTISGANLSFESETPSAEDSSVGNILLYPPRASLSLATTTPTVAPANFSGGGDAVTYAYQINIGGASAIIGSGYGVGQYGQEPYGVARPGFISTPPRTWALDKFGQNLLAMPFGGNLYKWELSVGTPAAIVSNAPTGNNAFFVTAEEHIVVLAAGGAKMRAEWSDQSDDTIWTPDSVNTAGGRTLVGGAELLAGVATEDTNLIFSDAAVFTMTFVGGLDVFGFERKSGGASGIISPNAAVDVDGVVYWMGRADFFLFDGAVRRVPNSKDIRRFVFDALRDLQKAKVYAQHLAAFSEIWWFIVRNDDEITGYIKYNYDDRTWDAGTVARTAMLDRETYDAVLMTDADSQLYQHENGSDADGSPMNEFIMSSPFDIQQLNKWVEVHRIFPDLKNVSAALELTLSTREYPQSDEMTEEIHTIVAGTPVLDSHISGRLASFKLGSAVLGSDWRFGTIHFDVTPGGDR